MAKSLVVVESPAKAKTINKFLGSDYVVKACGGHIRDLPEKELGVDIANGFRPRYVRIRGKGKIITALKAAARQTDRIFLATDPDREGEAIAWHVAQEISGNSREFQRILLHEITKSAVLKAMDNPVGLDQRKVNAQQARRILDRLVGYMVSPFLWKTVYGGLSAGRVQSVALRLICEREEEITGFIPKEYWSITASLQGQRTNPFEAQLVRIERRKADIPDEKTADSIILDLEGKAFRVWNIKRKEQKKNPPPPFTTSTLQQDAARRLNFSANKTMGIAQELYEGVDLKGQRTGLITYMRTDSTRIAMEAITSAREYIATSYGLEYVPQKPNVYPNKKGVQDAHEAIRPTSMSNEPRKIKKYLALDQYRLYELIWNRFLSCQMKPAVLDVKTIEIKADNYLFRASGSTVKFKGFMVVYAEGKDEDEEKRETAIPENLNVGEDLTLISLTPQQHFTKPPPRYTEATLVKELESQGIGRPSTYAQIISVIQEREYVKKEKGRFQATDLGMTVNRLLVGLFPDIFDVSFTAKMEENLDRVEAGEEDWVKVVDDFYRPFEDSLKEANQRRQELKKSIQEVTEEICEKCARPMVIKWGKNGRFLACSGFPDCRNTRPLQSEVVGTEERCDQCGAPMVVKSGPYGRFLGCSAYPKCKNTKPIDLGLTCPQPGCEGRIVERQTKGGKIFYGCSRYPQCKFATWNRPVDKICPACGAAFLVEKSTRRKGDFLRCLRCKGEFPQNE